MGTCRHIEKRRRSTVHRHSTTWRYWSGFWDGADVHSVTKLPVVLRPGEDGWIVAECPVLLGCVSQGKTREEALANIIASSRRFLTSEISTAMAPANGGEQRRSRNACVKQDLERERGIGYLYVTHDIASARYIADRTMVMYAGHMVEGGPSEALLDAPAHPYTQLLLEAVPDPTGNI